MTEEQQREQTGPYAAAADTYWTAGWRGILPLPERAKTWPPKGYTGSEGASPSYPDVRAWGDGREGRGNIALRLPRHVLGIDVDAYAGKAGRKSLADCEAAWGPLPDTWRTTSRDDGVSGIRLYAVPEGMAWPNQCGPAIETVHFGHRYAVSWPSIHPEGRTYRWISPEGLVSAAVPGPEDFPELPEAWVMGLTGGELAGETAPRIEMDLSTSAAFLMMTSGALKDVCSRMQAALDDAVGAMPGAAHDTAAPAAMRMLRLADEGHGGGVVAMGSLKAAFIAEITAPDRAGTRRSQRAAEHEWRSIFTSAAGKVAAEPVAGPACDCAGELTALITENVIDLREPSSVPVGAIPAQASVSAIETPVPAGRARTSWWPKDLASVLSGTVTEPEPKYLIREDGAAMFYPGRVNGLLGESESGKTWVALLAVRQAIAEGGTAMYLDFEDTAPGIVSRLQTTGMIDYDFSKLSYIGPDEMLGSDAMADLGEAVRDIRPGFIVVDGVNAAMTILGLDLNSNTDATKFAQKLLVPLSRSGAAVVCVDHVPKNKEARGKGGIGAQAKRAMMTGCALSVEVSSPFGRGIDGRLKLNVDKDRPGLVRAKSAYAKLAGMVNIRAGLDNRLDISIEPPDLRPAGERPAFRPTGIMAKVSALVAAAGADGLTGRAVTETVTGKATTIRTAIELLVSEGYITRAPASGTSGGGGMAYRSERAYYDEDADAGWIN